MIVKKNIKKPNRKKHTQTVICQSAQPLRTGAPRAAVHGMVRCADEVSCAMAYISTFRASLDTRRPAGPPLTKTRRAALSLLLQPTAARPMVSHTEALYLETSPSSEISSIGSRCPGSIREQVPACVMHPAERLRPLQVKSSQVSQVKSKTSRVESRRIKTSQVKSSQIKSNRVKTVKSNQDKSNPVPQLSMQQVSPRLASMHQVSPRLASMHQVSPRLAPRHRAPPPPSPHSRQLARGKKYNSPHSFQLARGTKTSLGSEAERRLTAMQLQATRQRAMWIGVGS